MKNPFRYNFIRRIRHAVRRVEVPKERLALLNTLIPTVEKYIVRIKERCNVLRREFTEWMEIYRGERNENDEQLSPIALAEPTRRGRLHTGGALFTLLFEVLIAILLMPIIGPIVAFLIAVVLDRILDYILRPEKQYWEVLRTTRRWLFIPGAIFVGLGAVAYAAGRGAFGAMAMLLSPFLSVAIIVVGIGLLFVFAAFSIAARVYNTSIRFEQQYDRLLAEQHAAQQLLDELRKMRDDLGVTPPSVGIPPPPRENPSLPAVATATLLFLLFAAGLGSMNTVLAQDLPPAQIIIYFDNTISPVDGMLQSVATQTCRALPNLCEDFDVQRVVIYTFNNDGWLPNKVFDVHPTQRNRDTVNSAQDPKLTMLFPGIAQAYAAESHRSAHQFQEDHLHELEVAFSGIKPEDLLPAKGEREPPCSDIDGTVEHAKAQAVPELLTLILIASDWDPHCQANLKPSSAPTNRTAAIAIVLPEKREQRHPSLKKLTGGEFHEDRVRAIQKSIPWLNPIPYSEIDYSRIFKDAIQRK